MDNLSLLSRIQDELRLLLIQLYDDMIKVMPTEEGLFYSRFYYTEQVSMKTVLSCLTEHLLPKRDIIAKREKAYFFNDVHIFNRLHRQNSTDYFKKIFTMKSVKHETVIWDYLDSIIKLTDYYVKNLGN